MTPDNSKHWRNKHLEGVAARVAAMPASNRLSLEELAGRVSTALTRVEAELEALMNDTRTRNGAPGPLVARVQDAAKLCAQYIDGFNAENPGMIGPVTRRSIVYGVGGAAGLLSAVSAAAACASVATAHLALSDYDVRPQPMDGGGGK